MKKTHKQLRSEQSNAIAFVDGTLDDFSPYIHHVDMVVRTVNMDELLVHKHRFGQPGRYVHESTLCTQPVAMLLWCPACGERHIDEGEWATKMHHTHACQSCGMVWRPAILATVGVKFLPEFGP